MTWLAPIPEHIPAALRALPAVVWRAESRGAGKPTKVPYQIAYPSRHASSTDPATWGTFDDAIDAQRCPELHLDGVGVVLTDPAGVTCLDLDGVLDPDAGLHPDAARVVARCASFTEMSPSGRGLHIFVRGSAPAAMKGAQIEVYSSGRYIAVTGHRWPGTPDTVRDAQAYLDALAAAARGDRPRVAYHGPASPPPDDLAGALLAKLHGWGVPVARVKPWGGGFLVELVACPWADEHTTGAGGAVVMIHASGAYDFMCQHAHCAGRRWREFRAAMEPHA